MRRRIACVVEGHGEQEAVPILLRRVQKRWPHLLLPELGRSDMLRIPRSKLIRPHELERSVELAARRVGAGGAILILLDADDDAPCELAPVLLDRATKRRPDRRIAVVLAKPEYEAWFIAAIRSLAAAMNSPVPVTVRDDPESIRDAKGWIARAIFNGRYRETLEQPRLSALMDLDQAKTAPSFDKFVRDVQQLLAPDAGSSS